MSSDAAGHLVALHQYPVKSMMGEELASALLTERGLFGDRAYALLDAAEGRVASAKNPRKWPGLFDFRAAYLEPPRPGAGPGPVRITLPDGAHLRSDAPDAEDRLSQAVGRPVRLASRPPERPRLEEYWPDMEGRAHREAVTDETMAPGTFFDSAPLLVMTTATLDALRAAYPRGRFETRRFRPNLVLAAEGPGFPEAAWVGRDLEVGGARLRVERECGRCVMTTLAQGDLPADPGILRTVVQHNRAKVGVYATVVGPGAVRRGDAARLR